MMDSMTNTMTNGMMLRSFKTCLRPLGIVLVALLLIGCGSEAGGGNLVRGSSSDLLRDVDCRGQGLALAAGELRRVPAEDIRVDHNGRIETLCDLLSKETGRQAAFFQFASADCMDCLNWVEIVHQGLDKIPDLLSVVIVVDDAKRLSNTRMASLAKKLAPNSIWVRDQNKAAWKFFGPKDATDVEPVGVLMDVAARGVLVEDTSLGASEVAALADSAMGTKLAP